MIIINRKEAQAFRVGGEITVLVQQIKGSSVRLLVKGPANMQITAVATASAEPPKR